ncbi:LysE family translocator [Pseudomonas grandcourensis]|uniref:LysE family translocator n=1 Tax=Pseudomonas grandcourensis TaxID=3136736 RepID=UPI0032633F74
MSFLTDSAVSFLITASALLASPGPATMALAASGAAYGLKRSLMFYSGIMAGLAISISLVASGIFLLIQKIPILAAGLGLISAAYIVLLAWSIARTPPITSTTTVAAPRWNAGFIIGVTNIKAYAVFAALLGGFPLGLPQSWDLAFKIAGCLGICITFDFLWLCSGNHLRRFFIRPRWNRALNISFAMLMISSVAWSLLL